MENLSLRDSGRAKARCWPVGDPADHGLGGLGSHELGHDVRIEYDHRSGFGGSRIGSRGRSLSSTPPSARNRVAMDAARLVGPPRSDATASRKMTRTSSSIERA